MALLHVSGVRQLVRSADALITKEGCPDAHVVLESQHKGVDDLCVMQDAIGRKWQCSTVQLDFNLPERFDMHYIDRDNNKQRPIMLHRAILGSIERFFGILIENYAGAFPAWLAPVQCRILPVNADCKEHCEKLLRRMKDRGIRADMVRRLC